MFPFFCLRCSEISISDERLRCSNCESDESRNVVADSFDLPVSETENVSPGYNVASTDVGNKKSEEFKLVETTREANIMMFEEDPNFSLQIQTADHYGYENFPEIESPSQNITSHAFDKYTITNHDRLPANLNTNEGEFHKQPVDICNAATSIEVLDDTPVASQQTNLSEKSSVGEGENRDNSDELLRSQRTKEQKEHGIKSDSFVFKDSITSESEYKAENLLSDSSAEVGDRHDKDNIPPSFSFCPRRNTSENKCFPENLRKTNRVAQKKPQTSNKLSYRRCGKCKRYFLKEWTFYAHMKNCCNSRKPYECGQCGAICREISTLLAHRRKHTGEKPFKCNQCDYASAWQYCLKRHLETHTNLPPSFSSLSRKKPPVNRYFPENLVTAKTVPQKNPQTSNKLKKMTCRKCGRFFMKESTFCAHVRSDCNPNPYKCGECGARFSEITNLLRHRRVHSGDKPFKCTQCDYATKWPSDLKKHSKTHR